MSAEIIHMEDWTHGEPARSPNQHLLNDLRRLAREIARLRRVESAALAVIRQHGEGNIQPTSPKACMAMAELGSSVVNATAWRWA